MIPTNENSFYFFTTSICMGSIVFGYTLTGFSIVNPLIAEHGKFTNEEDRLDAVSWLNNLPILSAIIGNLYFTQVWPSIAQFLEQPASWSSSKS